MGRYSVLQLVNATVCKITKYGIFVSLDEGYKGLIHISEISDRYVHDINDFVKVNEKIKAKIIGIDNKNKKLDLSIKNIDYKMNKKRGKIEETPHGFNTLKHMLPYWIEENIKNAKKNIKSVDKTGVR